VRVEHLLLDVPADPPDGTYDRWRTYLCTVLDSRAAPGGGEGGNAKLVEICADDVVYFDPFQERRLNGIDELRALYESIRGQVSIARFDLIDPRVQAVADMAVLTFNYVAEGTNEVTSRWNCTEVFRRDDGAWRIVQTHWSFTRPEGTTS